MTKRSEIHVDLYGLVEATKGLAHPARLRILSMLATGELCVCQMTAILDLAPSTVSQHLSVLERGGLVSERKEGKLVFYQLRAEGVASLLPRLLALAGSDAILASDRSEVARLRRIPVAVLCAAELDLEAVGVRMSRPAEGTLP